MTDEKTEFSKNRLILLREHGRFGFTPDGRQRMEYTALDPAVETFICNCGKPTCLFSKLQPFREHTARLYRAIVAAEGEDCFEDGGWQTLLYPLQIAASLEEVYADTAYVDDTQSITYCSSAADYEAGNTETASKYVAALSVFTFLWNAYEAAVRLSYPDQLKTLLKDARLGERGRRLFEYNPNRFQEFLGLKNIAILSEHLCERGNLFDGRLKRIRDKYNERGAVFSAELVREFRNFVVHGEDQIPDHEAWNHGRTPGEATARIRRFYAIGRLLLMLIQLLAAAAIVKDPSPIEWGRDDDFDPIFCDPKALLLSLHMLSA